MFLTNFGLELVALPLRTLYALEQAWVMLRQPVSAPDICPAASPVPCGPQARGADPCSPMGRPLCSAAFHGHERVVRLLLEAGADGHVSHTRQTDTASQLVGLGKSQKGQASDRTERALVASQQIINDLRCNSSPTGHIPSAHCDKGLRASTCRKTTTSQLKVASQALLVG